MTRPTTPAPVARCASSRRSASFSALLLALAWHVASPNIAVAEERISLELGDDLELIPLAQYRARFWAHSGRDFAAGDNVEFIGHRARLGVEIRAWDWLAVRVRVQDVRMWGEETNSLRDLQADGFDLHEGFIELRHDPWGLRLRIGRQQHGLTDLRLIGSNNWTDQARRYNGVLLTFRKPAWEANLFWARQGESDSPTRDADGNPRGDEDLAYGFVRYSGWRWLRPSLTVIYDRFAPVKRHRVTFGGRVDGRLRLHRAFELRYVAEGYVQRGESNDVSLAALFTNGRAGFAFPTLWGEPALIGFFERLSGDDADTEANETFSNITGNGHRWYGLMDIFLRPVRDADGRGLLDSGARLAVRPWRGFLVRLDFHHFALDQPIATPQGDRQYVGDELDLFAKLKINRYLSVQGGMGIFLPQDTITCLSQRGGACREDPPAELWSYMMMGVKI